MAQLDFLAAFYGKQHDPDSLVRGIDSLLASNKISACAIPFFTSDPARELFLRASGSRRQIIHVSGSRGCDLYRLTYVRNIGDQSISRDGMFYVVRHPTYRHTYVAMTLESADFIKHGLLPAIKYPRAVQPFVPHSRLKRMLDDFKEKNDFSQLIITRASQVLRLNSEGIHRRNMPMVSWPGMAIEEGFVWLDQHDGWFQSMQFEARDQLNRVQALMSIHRTGMVKADRLFAIAYNLFVTPICKTHYENMVLFSKRGRRENRSLAVKPLIIDFGKAQFDHLQENAKFIQAMRQMRTASVSVLHGNPYINLSVIDYYDGSNFDVWVLSKEQVIIVPQMKGTVPAIKRLINHIFDTYAEGDLRDWLAPLLRPVLMREPMLCLSGLPHFFVQSL